MSAINIAAWVAAETGIETDTKAKFRWNETTDRPFSVYFNSYFWPCLCYLRLLPAWISLLHVSIPLCTRRFSELLISYRDLLRDMSRSTRRYKSLNQGYGGPGCDRLQMPRARSLLFCLLAVLVLSVMLGVYLSNDTTGGHVDRMPALDLARDRVRHVRSNTRCSCIGWTGLCSHMC